MGVVKSTTTSKSLSINDSSLSNRATLEEKIAAANMEYFESNIVTLTDTPTIIVDLYYINMDHSTFRKGTDDVGTVKNAFKFDRVRDMVLLTEPANLVNDTTKEETKNAAVETNTMVGIVFPGVRKPMVESRLTRKFEKHTVVYKVVNVSALNYQNKPYHKIEYIVDTIFDNRGELLKRVVNTYSFTLEQVGGSTAAIVREDEQETYTDLTEIAADLNNKYNDAFYDLGFDQLVFKDRSPTGSVVGTYVCPAQAIFQTKYGPLLFRNSNTLLLNPVRKFRKELIDYSRSLYKSIPFRLIPETYPEPVYGETTALRTLVDVVNDSIELNTVVSDEIEYVPKYNYKFKVFGIDDRKNKTLTKFKSITNPLYHIRFMEVDGNPLNEVSTDLYLANKVLIAILDDYMAEEIDSLKTRLKLLRDYEIDDENFEHFMIIPIIVLIIKSIAASIIKSKEGGEWE